MEILAQHGHGCGRRVARGLEQGVLSGVIFGAKDIPPARLVTELETIADTEPESVRLFDPQYYASLIAGKPGARLGSLIGENSYPYFEVRRRRDLEREPIMNADLESVLQFQTDLPVTALIAPNIVIQRSFDSVEATISKNFLRNAATVRDQIGEDRPVYATLAVSGTALNDRIELQNFLQEITEIDAPPDGFYLILENPDSSIPATLTEPDILSRWMLINYTLKLSGFHVINGYADVLAPYLGAAGADAVASGWYNTLKRFSLRKFEPVSDFARRPVARYTSRPLLKSIRCTELQILRDQFDVMNGTACDEYYDAENGSTPGSEEEALQNWDCLDEMDDLVAPGDVQGSLQRCEHALDDAEALYVSIEDYGVTMRDRSSGAHIEALREELAAFAELAEL